MAETNAQSGPAVKAVKRGSTRSSSPNLWVPQAHVDAVPRETLLDLLLDEKAPRIALLQAPAGHGKTSLLVQVEGRCQAAGVATGWLSLDDTEDDANRLFDHLRQVAIDLGADQPARVESAAFLPEGRDASARLVHVFSAIAIPAAIFVDDLHFVRDPTSLRLLSGLLAAPLPGVRWFLASRTRPAINLARMLVNGDAAVHEAQALRFSADEAREFFARSGDVPSADELGELMSATEGWPAALQLYKLARRTPQVDPPGRLLPQSRELTDYLAENVLLLQEAPVRDFLLSTCVLERLHGDICAAVSGQDNATAVLTLLEERGLFVRRLSRSEGWFTYHTVFSGFLQNYVERHRPGRLAEQHLEAGRWYAEHQHHEEAVRHLAEAGAFGEAADVFERWLDDLVPSGYMMTADRWLDVIPAEELGRRSSLMVKVSWALAFLTRNRKLEYVLDLFHRRPLQPPGAGEADSALMLCIVDILADRLLESVQHIEHIDVPEPAEGGRFRLFELGVVCNARGYRMMATGELEAAQATLGRGAELNRRANSAFGLAYSIAMTALITLQQGRPREALALWEIASRETTQPMEDSLTAASLVCGRITGRYEAGDLDDSLSAFTTHRELIEVGAIHDHLALAHRAAARIYHVRGQIEQAIGVLERGWNVAMEREWPRVARLLTLEQVRIAVLAGELDRARALFGQPEPDVDPRIVRASAESEDETIALARLLTATGASAQALELVNPALKIAIRQGRVLRQIKLQLMAALAENQAGDRRRAHRSLQRALTLAAPGGCVQGILDEGAPVLTLVEQHAELIGEAGLGGQSPEVRRLLATLTGADQTDGARPASPPEGMESPTPAVDLQLTQREKDILRLLGRSLSNAEIAQATFVSTDTVKYHLKNLYAKLGARNRVDAARMARERGYS